jgi:hypothetical protein
MRRIARPGGAFAGVDYALTNLAGIIAARGRGYLVNVLDISWRWSRARL